MELVQVELDSNEPSIFCNGNTLLQNSLIGDTRNKPSHSSCRTIRRDLNKDDISHSATTTSDGSVSVVNVLSSDLKLNSIEQDTSNCKITQKSEIIFGDMSSPENQAREGSPVHQTALILSPSRYVNSRNKTLPVTVSVNVAESESESNLLSSNAVCTQQETSSLSADCTSSLKDTESKSRKDKLSLSQLICEPVATPVSDSHLSLHPNSLVEQAIDSNDGEFPGASLADVTAFLNMTSSTTNISEAESNMRLLSTINSNGIIQLLDSNGRVFCITTSDSEPSSAINTSLNSNNGIESYNIAGVMVNDSEQADPCSVEVVSNDVVSEQFDNNVISSSTQPSYTTKTSRSKKKKVKKTRPVSTERKGKGGWPKGRKRKASEYRIKAPASAYLIFAKKRRKEIMNEFPYYTFSEVTKIMGKEWTEMDVDKKEDYNRRADEDKKRFRDELKTYQQSQEYQNILKRKKEERCKALGVEMEDTMDEEMMLYCRICDQRFSNSHNRAEHLAGRVHLNNLQAELRKENKQLEDETSESCCSHCSKNRSTGDSSLDLTNIIETVIHKNSQRETEIQMLKENLESLKNIGSQLSGEMISLQDKQVKLKQDIQNMKQLSQQLTQDIDNLKMVPTLFGVINF